MTSNLVATIERTWGTELKPMGERFVMKCPFHRDAHPSLVIYPDTSSYFCFGCRRSGTLASLVREGGGVVSGTYSLLPLSSTIQPTEELPEVSFDILQSQLVLAESDLLRRFQVRFAVAGRYKGRYVIPYLFNRRIVAFELRDFSSRIVPKVICQPLGAPTKKVLWNIDNVVGTSVVLVEGTKDALFCSTFGVENVVSSSGAYLTKLQQLLLRKYKSVYVAYDADAEGRLGAFQAISELSPYVETYYVDLPEGKDPAECICDEFLFALENAKQVFDVRTAVLGWYAARFRSVLRQC